MKRQDLTEQQDCLKQIRASLEPHFDKAVDEATAAFLECLGNGNAPNPADVAAGSAAAHRVMKRHAMSEAWRSAVTRNDEVSQEQSSRIEILFDTLLLPPNIPQPQDASTMSPARLALVAAVGAIIGMMVFTPLARLLLANSETGLFIGAPVGAALLVLASWHVAHNKTIKRVLVTVLGVVTIIEVWALVSGGGVLGKLWRALGKRRLGYKRILVYALAIFVIVLSNPVPKIDRLGYEKTINCILHRWLEEAVVILAFLLHSESKTPVVPDSDILLCDLVAKIRALPVAGQENIDVAVNELIQETKNMGFVGNDGTQQLVWNESMREEYDTFALVEPGDRVTVERESVRFKDVVKQRGLVRKMRERR